MKTGMLSAAALYVIRQDDPACQAAEKPDLEGGGGFIAFCFCYKLPCPIHSAFFCGMGGIPTKFRSTQFPKMTKAASAPISSIIMCGAPKSTLLISRRLIGVSPATALLSLPFL